MAKIQRGPSEVSIAKKKKFGHCDSPLFLSQFQGQLPNNSSTTSRQSQPLTLFLFLLVTTLVSTTRTYPGAAALAVETNCRASITTTSQIWYPPPRRRQRQRGGERRKHHQCSNTSDPSASASSPSALSFSGGASDLGHRLEDQEEGRTKRGRLYHEAPAPRLLKVHEEEELFGVYHFDKSKYTATATTTRKQKNPKTNHSRTTAASGGMTSWWKKPRGWLRGGGAGDSTSSYALSSTAAPNFTNVDSTSSSSQLHHDDKSEREELRHGNAGVINLDDEYDNHQSDENDDHSPVFVSDADASSISAHLQLTDPNLMAKKKHKEGKKEEEENSSNNNKNKKKAKSGKVTIHTFQDPNTNTTWKALNTAKRKFAAFLRYSDCHHDDDQQLLALSSAIETNKLVIDQNSTEADKLRDEWRALWKEGRLLTDRTELLAVYPSDKDGFSKGDNNNESRNNSRKRGGFADLLHMYTDRLVAILQDEQDDAIAAQRPVGKDPDDTKSSGLVGWLENNYGQAETEALKYEHFRALDAEEQLAKLKHFLEWFRSLFPYFYDRCGSCGASFKEDSASQTRDEHTNSNENKDEDDLDDDREHETFVGYIFPSEEELVGKASRTELYQCHVCHDFTRFPRFNSASHVMDSRRGRCGEYSMLLFRFLRALNHECRWVVDWADHVWAEVLLDQGEGKPERWIHLDPCEAAVDENFIYQGWGKKQTFVLGFYLPPVRRTASTEASSAMKKRPYGPGKSFAMIEDITQTYTSDSWDDICKRREETEDQVVSAIERAIQELQGMLLNHEESVNNSTMPTTMSTV